MPAIRPAALAAAVFLLSSPAARAGDVSLEPHHQTGERWSLERDYQMTSSVRIKANGQVAQEVGGTERESYKATIDVLAVEGGKPGVIRARFDPAAAASTEKAGQVEKRPFGFAGKTCTIRGGANPVVECPGAQLGDDEKKKLAELIEANEGYLPKKPVKPGDRWLADEKAVARDFELGPEDRGVVKCKLREVKALEGRETAYVDVSIALVKVIQEFMKAEMDVEGTIAYDVATGQAVLVDLSGPVNFSGSRDVPGQNGQPVKVAVEGGGDMKLHVACRALPPGPSTAAPNEGTPPMPNPPAGGDGWASPPPGAASATPEKALEGMLAALEANDFERFRKLHTERAAAELTRDGFDKAHARLARIGPPPVQSFDEKDGTVTVTLQNGRVLTTFVKVGGEWRCDSVFAK
jgi:hypothetical protein